MSWRKCWIWGRLRSSSCSRSSRTGVGFPFFRFHLCLFLRLNQRVFLYSLLGDTDISFQILKKALYCLHLFPQSPDFVVTPPPSFTALKTRAHYVDLQDSVSAAWHQPGTALLLSTAVSPSHPKPDPFHSHLYPAFSLSRCLLRISRPASRRRSLICRAESLIHRRRVTGRAHRSINFLYPH